MSTISGIPRATPTTGRRLALRAGRVTRRRTPLGLVAERAALLVLCLIAWELFSRWVDNPVFPTLEQLWGATSRTLVTIAYWQAIVDTLWPWAVSLLVATVIGVPLGFAIGSSRVVNRLTRGTVDFMRTVPLIMLVPLFVLMFGATAQMKIAVILLTTVWPVLVQSSYGIREVERVARETVRSYGINASDRIRFLYLPAAAPLVATGLRIAATLGLLVSVGAEIMTSSAGIGFSIAVSQSNAEPARSFVFVLTTAALGLAINAVFARIERSVLFWHPAHRGANARQRRRGGRP